MWFLNHSGTPCQVWQNVNPQSKCTYQMHKDIICNQSSHASLDQHTTERRFVCLITLLTFIIYRLSLGEENLHYKLID